MMGDLNEMLEKLDIPTSKLNSDILQNVLIVIQKSRRNQSKDTQQWNRIMEVLWSHMMNGLSKIDNQLLCSTCFYNILTVIENRYFYFKNIDQEITSYIDCYRLGTKDSNGLRVLSLIYGIFQSSFLSSFSPNDIPLTKNLLSKSFNLLIVKANEYTQFTFLAFKIISSFKKLGGSPFQMTIFNETNQIMLLNLVYHNWENPIMGVRDLNKIIFQTLIPVFDKHIYKNIIFEINSFCWNKAKYLMLAEIISQETCFINVLEKNNDWIDGAIKSLYRPGLVSAGADMYYAMLKQLKCDDEWCQLFLLKLLQTLCGESFKAKENFFNYWCLTTLKRYPKILNVLFNEICKNENDISLYCALNLMKQGNRLGLVEKNWDNTSHNNLLMALINNGIYYIDPYVRLLAFDIVCIAQNTYLPTAEECDLVYKFLIDNINSDCTILRLGMLNSLKLFLSRLHVSFIHKIKQNNEHTIYKSLYEFCKNIQTFIVDQLSIKGNYQRKFTAIKICDIFFNTMHEMPKKRSDKMQNGSLEKGILIQSLKNENIWLLHNKNVIDKLLTLLRDPADDIRENVTHVLFNYYSMDLIDLNYLDKIFKDSFEAIKSKFFYEISCGQSMFKLITKLLIKHHLQNVMYSNIEDMFHFICTELIREHKLEKNILNSIENGKQLHSFITVLHSILKVCLQNKYSIKNELQSTTRPILPQLLETLEGISMQFLMEKENATGSYDFSKISELVNSIIEKSDYDPYNDDDKSKISGIHQIVLNTMWLNVKSSCELAALLIKCHTEDDSVNICLKCLQIIGHVLETSRHKGAIEAAGAALGQSIQHLSSLPDGTELSKIPENFLINKLSEMISEANRMVSVTRRGAGLSIMVHRIVANDTKKGKPLFHYFMETLLEACHNSDTEHTEAINDNEIDIPKAIYIHFLTRIVTDSTLASDIMYYTTNLTEIAFSNLTNDKWQIRNAALQLYGALVPKLIGQKKSVGHEDTAATVACDELRVHSPKLWSYLQNRLQNKECRDKIQSHSNLVPILNLLANCAKRYNSYSDLKKQMEQDEMMFNSFVNLLDSPIYTVRRLTAKCIYNMFPFELIYKTILQKSIETENLLHGFLMLMQICNKNYFNKGFHKNEFLLLKSVFKNTMSGKHSYLCQSLFYEIFCDVENDNLICVFEENRNNKHAPGYTLYVNSIINKHINICSWEMIPKILSKVTKSNDIELHCQVLHTRLVSESLISIDTLEEIVKILSKHPKKFQSDMVWQIFYQIALQNVSVFDDEFTSLLYDYLEHNEYKIPYKIRYILPTATRILGSKKCVTNKLMNAVFLLTNIECADIDMRYVCALANNEFGNTFIDLPDNMKVVAIKSTITLLQDEDDDVRNTSVIFYKNLSNEYLQPYVCLKNIINYHFLIKLFSDHKSTITFLCQELNLIIESYSIATVKRDDYNPFANDSKNIYFECDVLKKLVQDLEDKNK